MAWFCELKMRLPKRERKGGALDDYFSYNGAGIPAPFLYKGTHCRWQWLGIGNSQVLIAET